MKTILIILAFIAIAVAPAFRMPYALTIAEAGALAAIIAGFMPWRHFD